MPEDANLLLRHSSLIKKGHKNGRDIIRSRSARTIGNTAAAEREEKARGIAAPFPGSRKSDGTATKHFALKTKFDSAIDKTTATRYNKGSGSHHLRFSQHLLLVETNF